MHDVVRECIRTLKDTFEIVADLSVAGILCYSEPFGVLANVLYADSEAPEILMAQGAADRLLNLVNDSLGDLLKPSSDVILSDFISHLNALSPTLSQFVPCLVSATNSSTRKLAQNVQKVFDDINATLGDLAGAANHTLTRSRYVI